jgi:hypothetical protein
MALGDAVSAPLLGYALYRTLSTALSYGEWVAAGCPTEQGALAQAAEQSRARVLESLARLPVLQDERGLLLDELSPPALRCEACGVELEGARVERSWLLPQHALPGQDRPCAGAYAKGSTP